MANTTQYTVVVYWLSPEVDMWCYGPYPATPSEGELAKIRDNFMENTGTSEMDWTEFGCGIKVIPTFLLSLV